MLGNGLRITSLSTIARVAAALFLILITLVFTVQPGLVLGDLSPYGGNTQIVPNRYPLLFGSSGNVKIDIPVPGIAVRIEVPREFLQGVVSGENDTHWITSNIRNDYYYYNVVDESRHWTYDWQGNPTDGACFKPDFSYYDPNAPYCVEIWNYLGGPTGAGPFLTSAPYSQLLMPPEYNVSGLPPYGLNYTEKVGVNYCEPPNIDEFVFGCFTAPKFVMFHNLASPPLAGLYTFTVSVADRTNILGYPDFVNAAYSANLTVPVSMAYNAGSISGRICDGGTPTLTCAGPIETGKGIVYAMQCPGPPTACTVSTATIVARAYVDQAGCIGTLSTCGSFDLTGLAPGQYIVEGSAGVDYGGYAYSLTPYGAYTPEGTVVPTIVTVSANSETALGQLALRRAPLFCGSIEYTNANGNPIPSLSPGTPLVMAGYTLNPAFAINPAFPTLSSLNITVEATDSSGHVFRFRGWAGGTTSEDGFEVTTGVGVHYVGTDPYGTEYAGLPAPADVSPSGYQLTVQVWISGYAQVTPATVTITESPGVLIPGCGNQPTVSPSPVIVRVGGLIQGYVQLCNTQPLQACTLQSPNAAGVSLRIPTDALLGGNIVIEAVNSAGVLSGLTVIDGNICGDNGMPWMAAAAVDGVGNGLNTPAALYDYTVTPSNRCPSGKTGYASSLSSLPAAPSVPPAPIPLPLACPFPVAPPSVPDTCAVLPFFITGFSEYYDHSLSGVWRENDYGLPPGTYTLQVYMRGYELTSTSPTVITVTSGSVQTVSADMSRSGVFQVSVGSYDSRLGVVINGTRAIQAQLPWRFLNSSIPVTARVYFYASSGVEVGYVEALMQLTVPFNNEIGVISFTSSTFTVVFAGQNWSLRHIWFYGYTPTYVTNDTYTILAYTLGYVRQFPAGISASNQLVGFNQVLITLFMANEIDITVPILSNPQVLTTTPEYDHAIGQVFSGPLYGAEPANLTAGTPTLQFNIFGFGEMELSNKRLCNTNVLLVGLVNMCGQGHFYYVPPTGGCIEAADTATCIFDYGLDALTYTAALPEFGFTVHFLQIFQLPVVSFTDLLLQQGVFLEAIQMASITQGSGGVVLGYCNSPILGICLVNPPSNVAPLSWAEVQVSNSTYSLSTATFDGLYDGVGALFVPAGTYTITFSDVQYQSQTPYVNNFIVAWGGSYAIEPTPLCPIGATCP